MSIKPGDRVYIEAEVVRLRPERDYYMVNIRGVRHPVPVAAVAIHANEPNRTRQREMDFDSGRAPFQANLRRIRQGRNMTQRELADRVGVAQGAVWQWEAGKSFPRVATLEKVCIALEINPDDLFAKQEN